MKRIIILLLLIAFTAWTQEPNEQAPPAPWNIRSELLIARMPESRAIKFRREFARPEFAKRAQEELLRLIESKAAKLVDWPILLTADQSQAVSSNLRDHRYAIEFSRPNVISRNDSSAEIVDSPSAPTLKKRPMKTEDSVNRTVTVLAGVPSTFETRSVGVTLQLEATVSDDGRRIKVQAAPNHTDLKRYRPIKIESEGHTVVVEQPEFEILQRTGLTTVTSGESILWSFQNLQEPSDTVELSVLTVTAIDPTKEAR